MGKMYGKGHILFELCGFLTILDMIADHLIPDFLVFPKLPSFNWVKKHAYSAFAVIIKVQITGHIYKFLDDLVKAKGTHNEELAFEFVHSVFSLMPAFWVAVDLYRHSIKPKIPCCVAKVFAHIYMVALVVLIFFAAFGENTYIYNAFAADKLYILVPSFITCAVYLRRINTVKRPKVYLI